MAEGPGDSVEQALRLREASLELLAGAQAELRRESEAMLYQAEQARRERAAARVTAAAEQGAVRVIADGVGEVQRIELDPTWYARTGADRIGKVVLAALSGLDDARAPGEPAPPQESLDYDAGPLPPLLEELPRRLAEVDGRLAGARVKGVAANGGIEVEYDGMLRPLRLTVSEDARRRSADELAAQVTSAVRAAWKAATQLRERAYDDALFQAQASTGMPAELPDAATTVARAFGIER